MVRTVSGLWGLGFDCFSWSPGWPWFYTLAKISFELLVILPPTPKCWDYTPVPAYPVWSSYRCFNWVKWSPPPTLVITSDFLFLQWIQLTDLSCLLHQTLLYSEPRCPPWGGKLLGALWPRLQCDAHLHLLVLSRPSTPPYADLIWEESFRLGRVPTLSQIQSSAFFITYEYYDPQAHTGIKQSRQWQARYTHWIMNICTAQSLFPAAQWNNESMLPIIYTFNFEIKFV